MRSLVLQEIVIILMFNHLLEIAISDFDYKINVFDVEKNNFNQIGCIEPGTCNIHK